MKLKQPVFATYLEQRQVGNMAAQRTVCKHVPTALPDTCWSTDHIYMCWSKEVREISSVTSAVTYR